MSTKYCSNCGELTQACACKNLEDRLPSPLEVLMGLAPNLEEDILLACRSLYYVKNVPVIPDELYDKAERQFMDRPELSEDSPLMNPGSDQEQDYSPRARALAFYLSILAWEAGQRAGQLPTLREQPSSAFDLLDKKNDFD